MTAAMGGGPPSAPDEARFERIAAQRILDRPAGPGATLATPKEA